jgi:hypothetical protein
VVAVGDQLNLEWLDSGGLHERIEADDGRRQATTSAEVKCRSSR